MTQATLLRFEQFRTDTPTVSKNASCTGQTPPDSANIVEIGTMAISRADDTGLTQNPTTWPSTSRRTRLDL